MSKYGIPHEICVTNDNSKDHTAEVLDSLMLEIPTLVYYTNPAELVGYSVQYGLERFTGDCVAVFMADMSDDPEDLVKFYYKMLEGDYDVYSAIDG